MDHLNYFGDCLKELLADSGMSIKELSEKTKIRLSRLYDFLNKEHIPSLENAIKIADVFRCPLDYLFGFIADFTPQTFTVTGSVSENVKAAIDNSKPKPQKYQHRRVTTSALVRRKTNSFPRQSYYFSSCARYLPRYSFGEKINEISPVGLN